MKQIPNNFRLYTHFSSLHVLIFVSLKNNFDGHISVQLLLLFFLTFIFLFWQEIKALKKVPNIFQLKMSTSHEIWDQVNCSSTVLICFHFSVHSVHLYYLFPNLEEGGLATYRTAIVQNQHLAMLAKVNSPPPVHNKSLRLQVKTVKGLQTDRRTWFETVLLFSVLALWLCFFLRGHWGEE